MAARNHVLNIFMLGVELDQDAACFFGKLYCCLNTQLTPKSKYHNAINLVALNVLGC